MPADQSPAGAARTLVRAGTQRRGLVPRDEESAELLDLPELPDEALRANLRDIRKVNRLGGGTNVVLRRLPPLLRRIPRETTVTILDLATGSGDIPLAIAHRLRRAGRPLALTLVDVSPQILDVAKRHLATTPGVAFVLADARAVPYPDRAFDIVLCSLSLHHFSPPDAVQVLGEMERLARVGFIVNDVRRSLAGLVTAWIVSRVATQNALTRHDMPLSVRRAYTPGELRALFDAAGIPDATVTNDWLFRMAALRVKDAV